MCLNALCICHFAVLTLTLETREVELTLRSWSARRRRVNMRRDYKEARTFITTK